jgi:hypothetical protein
MLNMMPSKRKQSVRGCVVMVNMSAMRDVMMVTQLMGTVALPSALLNLISTVNLQLELINACLSSTVLLGHGVFGVTALLNAMEDKRFATVRLPQKVHLVEQLVLHLLSRVNATLRAVLPWIVV